MSGTNQQKILQWKNCIAANMPPKLELTVDQQKQVVSQLLLLVKDDEPEQKLVGGALTDHRHG
jgi:hypothetical protein